MYFFNFSLRQLKLNQDPAPSKQEFRVLFTQWVGEAWEEMLEDLGPFPTGLLVVAKICFAKFVTFKTQRNKIACPAFTNAHEKL